MAFFKRIMLLVTVLICWMLSWGCERIDVKKETDIFEKGYNLPIDDAAKEEAESDCKTTMERIIDIYVNAEKGTTLNVVLSEETVGQIFETIKKATGCPVAVSGFRFNMWNYEKMEAFLNDSKDGINGAIITYEIYSDGGIGRKEYIYDGMNMYVLSTTARWTEENTPIITYTSYNRINEWTYTEKGWLLIEYCVPEPPEVSEVVNGNEIIRVKPLNDEYGGIAENFLLPLGYQGNNLLCSTWDAKHMEDLDYNGLFPYLFTIKYKLQLHSDSYADGIPKETFESILMEYLPITAQQLEQYAVYDAKTRTYAWAMLNCGNYAPNAFGTSEPEIIDIKENEDGTVTLIVDAVCEMMGSDKLMSHQLKVKFLENGSIQFLENQILGDGLERIPNYQYRFKKDNKG